MVRADQRVGRVEDVREEIRLDLSVSDILELGGERRRDLGNRGGAEWRGFMVWGNVGVLEYIIL